MKNSFLYVIFLIFLMFLPGCAIIQQGGDTSPKNKKKLDDTTFVYTYSKNNKPIEAARVKDNVSINVVVKDPETGEKYDTSIDAGGWILVKPESVK